MGKDDITIAGPGSPVSLRKFIQVKEHELREFTLMVDGTGMGIVKDDESCMYVTPEECMKQALYYRENIFDGEHIPGYLYRYLAYMFLEGEGRDGKKYKNDQELLEEFRSGRLHTDHEDYKQILNLIRWCNTNKEAAQVIGMIQLIAGSLNIARKNNSGIRLYVEHPETSLHPKRQSRSMSMIMMLRSEYGFGKDAEECLT